MLSQISSFRAGDILELEATLESAGADDLISRGHGDWDRPPRQRLFVEYWRPLRGPWQLTGALDWFEEGLGGRALKGRLTLNWYPRDDFNLQFTAGPLHSPNWLAWEDGRAFGRYARRSHVYAIDANWFPGRRHELRLKAQWLAIDAREGRRYLLENGRMLPTGEALPDFTVNNFGLQLRYRYEIAPQSELYLVYSRGGLLRQTREPPETLDLLDEALRLRDADQFLAKLRYRF